jgi:hypothetical protein
MRRDVHKWDFGHPSCLREELRWFIRWPLEWAVGAFFLYMFLAPFIHGWFWR